MTDSPIKTLHFVATLCDEMGVAFGAKDLEFDPETRAITGCLTVGKGEYSVFCSVLSAEAHALGHQEESMKIEILSRTQAESELLYAELEQKALTHQLILFAE